MIQTEKLILLRKEKRLTQMQVAEEINVSRQAISGWETGTVMPSTENLKSLSILYGVPVDYLLSKEDESFTPGITESRDPKVHNKMKKRAIIALAAIVVVLVCIGIFLFSNGDLLHEENKRMDSANVDKPMWEEQDLSRKGVTE